jgi:transcription elongation factor/antiterminator RfaH
MVWESLAVNINVDIQVIFRSMKRFTCAGAKKGAWKTIPKMIELISGKTATTNASLLLKQKFLEQYNFQLKNGRMNIDRLVQAWYVVHTKNRFENVVFDCLNKKSLETFLPKIMVQSKRKDRRKMIRVPLFPGYLFVKTDLNPTEHLEILKTTGAVRLIGNNDGPISVPNSIVHSLKIIVATENKVITGNRLQRGDRVIVVDGPFRGVRGIFSRYKGQGRVVVHIEALGQFAAVDVSEEDVEKMPSMIT